MRFLFVSLVGALVAASAASGRLGDAWARPVSWAPPTLSNPIGVNVTNANRRLFLDDGHDYRLTIVEPLKRELWIEGGRNVVVVGGHITIDELGGESSYQDNTAVKVRSGDPAGTVHIEGLLIEGPYVNDGIAIATGRNVQIENVRVAWAHDDIKGGHADCVQIQQGVGHLRIDGFTCTTERQGIFLGDHSGPIRSANLRRVNMYAAGGKHLLWQTSPTYPVALSDVWLAIAPGYLPWAPFGYWVYPDRGGGTPSARVGTQRRAVVSRDGKRLWFVGSRISGLVRRGIPGAGDFVAADAVGAGYASPGHRPSPRE